MNEVIKEQPDVTAAKMAQYVADIDELKSQLDSQNLLIARMTKQQQEFVSVGPLKMHIEHLQEMLHDKDMQLANEKIDREEYRQRLNEIEVD